MKKDFLKNIVSLFVFVFLTLSFSSSVFAGNPASPISPSDNIQDPGALSTPWGGCGPSDSNCYITTSSGSSSFSSLSAAGATNTIDNLNFAQQWDWSTADNESPLTITGNSLTTGSLLSLVGNRNGDASTAGLLRSVATVNTTGFGTVNNLYIETNNTNTTSSNSVYGIQNVLNDNTNLDNSVTGAYNVINITGSGSKNITALSGESLGSVGLTGASTLIGVYGNARSLGGVVSSGTHTLIGVDAYGYSQSTTTADVLVYGVRAGARGTLSGAGTINLYGVYVSNEITNTTGTSKKYGIYVADQTGADNNYGAIFAGGNVGIGTATPDLFTVANPSGVQKFISINKNTNDYKFGDIDSMGGHSSYLAINSQVPTGSLILNFDNQYLSFENNSLTGQEVARIQNAGSLKLGDATFFEVNNTNQGMYLMGGDVGIGDSTPDYFLDVEKTSVDGNIFALTDSDGACLHNPEAGSEIVTCSSDQRLKQNIIDAGSALDYFRPIQIREYDVIASGNHMTGVIAQEMLSTHPELVSQGLDGIYSVQLPNQWQVIKAIQELDISVKSINSLLEENNSFADKLRAWLANATNKITRIFTGEICLTDPDGTSECLNKSELKQLKSLLNSSNNSQVTPAQDPEPQPEELPPSEPSESLPITNEQQTNP